MWEANHLGHQLVLDIDSDQDFHGIPLVCEFCKFRCFYYGPERNFEHSYDGRLENVKFEDLTCEEVIIKKIIE